MESATHTFFTPVQTFLGGYLLHMSTTALLEDTGTVMGVSGIADGLVWGSNSPSLPSKPFGTRSTGTTARAAGTDRFERYWRLAIVAGLVLAPVTAGPLGLASVLPGASNAAESWAVLEASTGLARLGVAGLLVGIGSRVSFSSDSFWALWLTTKLGSGCTSGHFLCGASRLSPRSIIATATFFPIAMLTAHLFPLSSTNLPQALSRVSYHPTYPPLTSLSLLLLPLAVSYVSRLILRRVLPASPARILRLLPYLLSGWSFGMGLVMSGMANPLKVLSFLRVSPLGRWDPSLAMVFLGGVIPNALSYQLLVSRAGKSGSAATPKPNYPWATWRVPSRKDLDWRLILGSAIFGLGWGLGGVCPGPAIVGLGGVGWSGISLLGKGTAAGLVMFALSMMIGMKIGREI